MSTLSLSKILNAFVENILVLNKTSNIKKINCLENTKLNSKFLFTELLMGKH